MSITANKDSFVRTNPFSVTVTGRPSEYYHVWVKNTVNMHLGEYNNAPPVVTKYQDNVVDGSPITAVYEFGNGIVAIEDNAYGDGTYFSYARIKTSTAGTRVIEFSTDGNTKAQKFTIRVEQKFGDAIKSDEVDVNVGKDAVTPSKMGVIRNNKTWILDANGDGAYGNGDIVYNFGTVGDVYVTGDWNGDGTPKIGVVRNNNTWLLDASGDGKWGPGDFKYTFGKAGDRYVSGDWTGTGTTKIGVVRFNTTWLLDASGDGKWGPGDYQYVYGRAGDVYVTGDWNDNRKTEIGVVRNNKTWILDASGNGAYGVGDLTYTFGTAGDVYVTGDWNGYGTTRIGVVRSNTTWLLDASGDGKWGPGDYHYTFGNAGDRFVTGKWNNPAAIIWNWFVDGWNGWSHSASWSGTPSGPNYEYGPFIVNGHGEHGAFISLYGGIANVTVGHTFNDLTGKGWNTITFNGNITGSDVPAGRWMKINVNGQEVFSGNALSYPPGNNQQDFKIQRTFPQSSTVTINISHGQNPAYYSYFVMDFNSLKLTKI